MQWCIIGSDWGWAVAEVRFGAGDFYVSPAGNDRWSGRLAEPDQARTDGPFATIGGAREAVRRLKGLVSSGQSSRFSGGLRGPITVWLRGGTYRVSAPITFDADDSGPVTYAAYPGESPVIDGSERITGWRTTSVGDVKAWVAEIPESAGAPWGFRELYVNGTRRPRPRFPRDGLLRMARVPGLPESGGWGAGRDYTKFVANPGDLRNFVNLQDVEVVYLHFWIEERSPIAAYDPDTETVTMDRPSCAPLYGSHGSQLADYYLDNVYEELSEPGQWYLDRAKRLLYYVPLPGEDPATTEVCAPRALQLLALRGDPDRGRFVDYLRFRGITFQNTDWRHPDPSDGADAVRPSGDHVSFESRKEFRGKRAAAAQAACDVPGVIFLEAARHCGFDRCTVQNVGWYGFEIADASWGIAIERCTIRSMGAGGVRVNGASAVDPAHRRTGGHAITDNTIHAGGRVFHSAAGILLMHASDTEASHNLIHDLFYTGISCGWVWGYMDSVSKHNRIEKNHIHTIGQGLLSDMGGIYTLGVQPGTVLRGNLIHDVRMAHYGGWCIYPDEGSSHLLIENNVCYSTNDTIFHQHYGRENLVRNNVFAFGESAVLAHGKAEKEHCSIRFERNVLLTDGKPIFRAGHGCRLHDRNHASDLNLLWDVSARQLTFAERDGQTRMSFQEWKSLGHDRHSIVADPRFVDPRGGDYSLSGDSPLGEIGFEPIDLSDVGPRA
jgi:hypothetical protein